ncbi:helix-turn-helix domain-containing protein [Neobacillus drentensis]|mgnify:CR=1 FL=1|uniref:helix-turn-helix domain-containing protein n=1 Tax=Neobacillus drentensis TaxID=220684 RepID=UPI001F3A58EB|nr:helix-turn-helix domain-containing protein [Neobacillus drentensis]ULT56837.1 helix-turn-helix domain-containing protein [Neobacillus drentensis]HSU79853.1 helix-turn-helix domain-containing protein [Candidatus Angelobacter sp.]
MALSEKLRELRDKQNWSQETLADMMKMHRSTISRYETGKAIPNYQTVIRFAEIYKVDKEYLVDELNQLLPNVEAPGFVLKEKLEDPDVGLIFQLMQDEPELKKALIELHLMPPKRRSFYSDTITTFIKVNKRHKDKM